LAKKPPECLEYMVVHEMMHMLEPTHNRRFMDLMDRLMPNWRFYRQSLNRLPFVTKPGNTDLRLILAGWRSFLLTRQNLRGALRVSGRHMDAASAGYSRLGISTLLLALSGKVGGI